MSLSNSSENQSSEKIVISENTVVSFHYKMYDTNEVGKKENCLEDSFSGEPIYYLHGLRNIIPGLETAMTGKTIGDSFEVALDPIDAYGPVKPNSIQRVPAKHLQFHQRPKKILPGMVAGVKTDKGIRNVVVVKAGKFNVDVDFNHPLAGKHLIYNVQIESIRQATEEEIAHRHVHGPGGHNH